MSESAIFEWMSSALEQRTALSRLESRGTLRLVLKELGLNPGNVTAKQMQVIVQRVLAPALEKRRVAGAADLCAALAAELESPPVADAAAGRDAYDVFERMAARSGEPKKPR